MTELHDDGANLEPYSLSPPTGKNSRSPSPSPSGFGKRVSNRSKTEDYYVEESDDEEDETPVEPQLIAEPKKIPSSFQSSINRQWVYAAVAWVFVGVVTQFLRGNLQQETTTKEDFSSQSCKAIYLSTKENFFDSVINTNRLWVIKFITQVNQDDPEYQRHVRVMDELACLLKPIDVLVGLTNALDSTGQQWGGDYGVQFGRQRTHVQFFYDKPQLNQYIKTQTLYRKVKQAKLVSDISKVNEWVRKMIPKKFVKELMWRDMTVEKKSNVSKIILFTDRTDTPSLLKSLSNRFLDRLQFFIVRKQDRSNYRKLFQFFNVSDDIPEELDEEDNLLEEDSPTYLILTDPTFQHSILFNGTNFRRENLLHFLFQQLPHLFLIPIPFSFGKFFFQILVSPFDLFYYTYSYILLFLSFIPFVSDIHPILIVIIVTVMLPFIWLYRIIKQENKRIRLQEEEEARVLGEFLAQWEGALLQYIMRESMKPITNPASLDDMFNFTRLITYTQKILSNKEGECIRSSLENTLSMELIQIILQYCPPVEQEEDKKRAESDDTENCAVCQETFLDQDQIRIINLCNHQFHQNCLDPWLTKCSKYCPLCRKSITQERENQENSTVNILRRQFSSSSVST